MPTEPIARASSTRVVAEALAGELIGAPLEIPAGPGRSAPIVGTIVDESMHTFSVREPGRFRARIVPKAGLIGTVGLPAGEIPLSGELLRVRPEDRTKRLLAGGPRRFR